MSRNLLIVASSLVIIVIVGFGTWIVIRSNIFSDDGKPQEPSVTFPTPQTPGQSGTNPGITPTTSTYIDLTNEDGTTIQVKNFKLNPLVTKDPNNPKAYNFAGANPALTKPPYHSFYIDSDESFHIALYIEPLGAYRVQAEQDLMGKLGLSEQNMCLLKYVVAVGPGVNDTYVGKNLGFSFCPGATKLP
ncbi:MAG: hypothetical protein WAV21_03100 [Minisyncoccia bacterium]